MTSTMNYRRRTPDDRLSIVRALETSTLGLLVVERRVYADRSRLVRITVFAQRATRTVGPPTFGLPTFGLLVGLP